MPTIAERLAKLETSVNQLEKVLSNDIKSTLGKIFDKIDIMCPLVKDNAYWVGKWKQAIFWIAVMAMGGGMIALAFQLIKMFANK